ncbi:MAG: hypothetical protein A3E37_02820 [Candidatus Andersenbacteria bacterium RIFCSPHIGHO2_12_FULL_46_9]|nr:MAG: hypothetical protein UW94_C0007G0027 [Parcubacteria group bacterium GW2011_GWA2_45_14]OGY33024.1 MAG: hypothetical protein A3B76_01265 [Candidatus Andersenbacteria bacterium RIFCSPHIGHO2_02_FULL_46_16]OGY36532.1 MAG: hypothetical protein A3E37_02820 [Candidatus Andersenbacteria bacterium RIFCSPHIGHO2_12_FULL_46_9]OGY37135.1 MAG: hypothetical protein A3I08_02115 [Candidatus Andersenbacteria bacterium RIFCSPLOWO2_02_FULL_46_11]OGY39499.1 MAG: hypothetical protein A3G57_04260 [Candidatus A
MDIKDRVATQIIKEQELIIGPIAWKEAGKVPGLRLDSTAHMVYVEGDVKAVLESLVGRYERLFGQLSRDVCRDAVRPYIAKIPEDQLPTALR